MYIYIYRELSRNIPRNQVKAFITIDASSFTYIYFIRLQYLLNFPTSGIQFRNTSSAKFFPRNSVFCKRVYRFHSLFSTIRQLY